MVSGFSSQCAETIKIAFGCGSARPHALSSAIHTGSSSVKGEPCARKITGIMGLLLGLRRRPGRELGVDLQVDLVAPQHAAGLERLVPAQAPLLAADLAGGRHRAHRLAPRAPG